MDQQSSRKRTMIVVIISLLLVLAIIIGLLYLKENNRNRQKALLDNQQAQFSKTATADPILRYLPYGSIGYNIEPTFKLVNGNRVIIVQISVILDGADYKLSQQDLSNTIDQREQAAISYLRSKGIDPSKYTIQYLVPPH